MKLLEYSKPKIPDKLISSVAMSKAKNRFSDVADVLARYGWVKFREGAFSKVFTHPKKSYVLKFTENHDPAFLDYVAFIHRNKNIHFPKISDMKTITVHGHKYCFFLIEKLIFGGYNYEVDNEAGAMQKVLDYSHRPLEKIFPLGVPEFLKKDYSLVQALRLIAKNNNRKHDFDLHGRNFMRRTDGTIVITDPLA